MRLGLVILAGLLLTACSSIMQSTGLSRDDESPVDLNGMASKAVASEVQRMANQLVSNSEYIKHENPLAITSFVMLDTLEDTNWLGNQIAESFVHQMHERGFKVIEFKNTGTIKVTPRGDYIFSRNWKELKKLHQIDYVLTGTMSRQDDGVTINTRIIGMRSDVVVATAEGFIPSAALGDTSKLDRLRMKDGMLLRTQKELSREQIAVSLSHGGD